MSNLAHYRETLALPVWQKTVANLGTNPVVLERYERVGGFARKCTSHADLPVHAVDFLVRAGVLKLHIKSEESGLWFYVRVRGKS